MRKQQWEVTTSVPFLVSFIDNATERKKRLFCVAACYSIYDLIDNESCRSAVEAAEMYADGNITLESMEELSNAAFNTAVYIENYPKHQAAFATYYASMSDYWGDFYKHCSECIIHLDYYITNTISYKDRNKNTKLLNIIRSMFTPFHTPALPKNPVITQLAQTIYDSKDFDSMPILADALEEYGCEDQISVNFARTGKHYRGSWLLDSILNKE